MASEPFRLFFFSGALWSVVGVLLWVFYYAGMLTFFPGMTHARIMVENFGGAFVVGFLGTAGPRMLSGPGLTRVELVGLLALHLAGGICHLRLMPAAGDGCFAAMLAVLAAGLAVRAAGCLAKGKGMLRPQLALALGGLGCGMSGAVLLGNPAWLEKFGMEGWRMAGLLLYQGFLLLPVMGMGSFLFPRFLGGGFGGEDKTGRSLAWDWVRALLAAGLVLGSFGLECRGWILSGYGLRIAGAAGYLAAGVPWRGGAGKGRRGTLTKALYWAMGLGLAGLGTGAIFYDHHVAAEHLLYVGGFGLVILVAASRVIFGHSGDLSGFSGRSWQARTILTLVVLAATTRASADLKPSILISHHRYAALLWAGCVLLWMAWHGRRWARRDDG